MTVIPVLFWKSGRIARRGAANPPEVITLSCANDAAGVITAIATNKNRVV
jgi:hypothetical protein